MRAVRVTALAAIGALLLGVAAVEAATPRLRGLSPHRAATAAPAQPPCTWNGYDLSSLMGTDFVGTDGSTKYSYYMSVCGAMSSTASSFCVSVDPTVAACQYEIDGNMQTFDLGNWNPSADPQWSFIDPGVPSLGLQYQLTGAKQCWSSGTAQTYQTTVQFYCASAQSKGFKVKHDATGCGVTLSMSTPLSCPGPGQYGATRPTTPLKEN